MTSRYKEVENFLGAFTEYDELDWVIDRLVSAGFIKLSDSVWVREELEPHWGTELYPDDGDYDSHCVCGKWLEAEYYEWDHHVAVVLDDLGVLAG